MSSEDNKDRNKDFSNLGTPKNFLVPMMLLHLRDWNAHGYELMKKLSQFGLDSIDKGNFYRILRQLEKDAMVTSEWDTTSGGPAKRIYSITASGEKYLELWAGSLGHYQQMLDQFFNLYNPFFSAYTGQPNKADEEPEENDHLDEQNDL